MITVEYQHTSGLFLSQKNYYKTKCRLEGLKSKSLPLVDHSSVNTSIFALPYKSTHSFVEIFQA